MRIEKAGAPNAGSPGVAAAATVARVTRDDGAPIVFQDVNFWPAPGDQPIIAFSAKPCPDAVGRLRLRRIGSTLHFLWGRGTTGENSEDFHSCDFGLEDVVRTRLTAVTDRKPCALEIRLLDLRIRSGPSTADAKSRRWLVPA
jgi:hypothetical protein